MLIHDFDIFRWILGDEAATLHATGSCLTDPAVGEAGDIDATAVTIRTSRDDCARSIRSAAPPTATTSASRCSGAAACCRRATIGRPRWCLERAGHLDRQARALLPRALPRRLRARNGALLRDARERHAAAHDDRGRVAALALAEAATTSWRERRIVEL